VEDTAAPEAPAAEPAPETASPESPTEVRPAPADTPGREAEPTADTSGEKDMPAAAPEPPAEAGTLEPPPEPAPQANPTAAAHLLSASRGYKAAERRRYMIAGGVGLLVILLTVGFYYYSALDESPTLAYTGPQAPMAGALVEAERPVTEPPAAAPLPAPETAPKPVAKAPAPPKAAPKPAARPTPPPRKKAVAPKPRNKARIVRATRPGNDLLLAYQAYQAGRLAEARALYLKHLKLQPRSRDALLGLGAIALHEGRLEDARARYRAVLELDPGDATARAALASLDRPADIPASEAQLQLLLRQQPQAAHLHFALGNLYAAQGRWPLAQQQYFEAFRLSPDNPDYAFNLAVALDRLGEEREALAFYRKALDLNHRGLARFDSLAARARIQALEQGAGGADS
jgi:tetratricopeptide (TPR) repeat protein